MPSDEQRQSGKVLEEYEDIKGKFHLFTKRSIKRRSPIVCHVSSSHFISVAHTPLFARSK